MKFTKDELIQQLKVAIAKVEDLQKEVDKFKDERFPLDVLVKLHRSIKNGSPVYTDEVLKVLGTVIAGYNNALIKINNLENTETINYDKSKLEAEIAELKTDNARYAKSFDETFSKFLNEARKCQSLQNEVDYLTKELAKVKNSPHYPAPVWQRPHQFGPAYAYSSSLTVDKKVS